MNTHTPGPWHVAYYLDGWAVAPSNDPGHMVMRMQNRPGDESNARLIAAAPELLEALEGCLAYFEDLKNAPEWSDMRDAAPDVAWLAPVRAAIAKAKGETS